MLPPYQSTFLLHPCSSLWCYCRVKIQNKTPICGQSMQVIEIKSPPRRVISIWENNTRWKYAFGLLVDKIYNYSFCNNIFTKYMWIGSMTVCFIHNAINPENTSWSKRQGKRWTVVMVTEELFFCYSLRWIVYITLQHSNQQPIARYSFYLCCFTGLLQCKTSDITK